MRICYWDLETSNLNPDVGRLLCASVMDSATEEIITFRNDKIPRGRGKGKSRNMADDREVALQMRNEIEKYHMSCGWFTKGFDFSFLNTRLAAAGERLLKPHLHVDGVWFVKGWRGIKPRRGSLEAVAEFFKCQERKMDVDLEVWIDAALGGDSDAMDILVDRCESDVRVTKLVTEKILDLGLIRNIQRYP